MSHLLVLKANLTVFDFESKYIGASSDPKTINTPLHIALLGLSSDMISIILAKIT